MVGAGSGSIQGVMASYGCLDVDAERDRTRPLYQEAYSPGEGTRTTPHEALIDHRRLWQTPVTRRKPKAP